MSPFSFKTGRNYGTEQIIEVTAVESNPDQEQYDALYSFTDASRNISGKVLLFGFEQNSKRDIQEAILREYDAGRYFN